MTIRASFSHELLNFGKSVVKSWEWRRRRRREGCKNIWTKLSFIPDNFLLHKLFYKGKFKWRNCARVLYSKICWILDRAILINVKFSNYLWCFGPPSFPRLNDSQGGNLRKRPMERNIVSYPISGEENYYPRTMSGAKWTYRIRSIVIWRTRMSSVIFWACYSRTKDKCGVQNWGKSRIWILKSNEPRRTKLETWILLPSVSSIEEEWKALEP